MQCLGCGQPLTGMRRTAKFHNEACRSAYRKKKLDTIYQAFWGRLGDIPTPWADERRKRRRKAGTQVSQAVGSPGAGRWDFCRFSQLAAFEDTAASKG
jgi:hypothetical protein